MSKQSKLKSPTKSEWNKNRSTTSNKGSIIESPALRKHGQTYVTKLPNTIWIGSLPSPFERFGTNPKTGMKSKRVKGRKLIRKMKDNNIKLAFSRMTGNQAIKFLHPRRLRNAIINKTIPDGVFAPTQ